MKRSREEQHEFSDNSIIATCEAYQASLELLLNHEEQDDLSSFLGPNGPKALLKRTETWTLAVEKVLLNQQALQQKCKEEQGCNEVVLDKFTDVVNSFGCLRRLVRVAERLELINEHGQNKADNILKTRENIYNAQNNVDQCLRQTESTQVLLSDVPKMNMKELREWCKYRREITKFSSKQQGVERIVCYLETRVSQFCTQGWQQLCALRENVGYLHELMGGKWSDEDQTKFNADHETHLKYFSPTNW